MSSSLSQSESSSGRNSDSLIKGNTKGSKEGKEYEKIALALLAERGYELSKDNNTNFRNFAIGREVVIGEDSKLDDIVFRYEDKDRTKNLIFVQIKHKQDDSLKINYQVLFGSGSGNMGRDFKLRKYFISYRNIRESLKTTTSKELKNSKISYIAIFTNISVDEMELNNKGITLKEAPDDIKILFALKKSSFERREANHCYQFSIDDNDSDDLISAFKKCSDPHRIAKDLDKAQNSRENSPDKWDVIKDDDIKYFFKCFVLFVNQPNVTGLLNEIYPMKNIFLQGTQLGASISTLHEKFRERIEKALEIYNKNSNKEVWLSGEQIIQFVQELQNAINTCVMTTTYKDKVMKYGRFKNIRNLRSCLGKFLNDKWNKVFCLYTPTTLLTTLKVLQYLDTKKCRESRGQIYMELNHLKEVRDHVEKAFRSENNKLLIIECRYTVNELSVDELCRNYSDIIKENHNKKLIIICMQNESTLAEKFRFYLNKLFQSDCDPEKIYVQETDDVNLQDFEPAENPLEKEVIVFQGQKEKVSLARLTGFKNWNSYLYYLAEDKVLDKAAIADIMIEILNNNDIEIGSKPPGTSSLEGAHDTLFEEINSDTLLNKLLNIGNKPLGDGSLEDAELSTFQKTNSDTLAQNFDNNPNEIFIFDGIKGSNIKEKTYKLSEYLGVVDQRDTIANMLGDIGSDMVIQVAYDNFKDENFKQVCRDYPKRKIFWISVKDKENKLKFILQGFYNPNFYLKRKFKIKVIDKKIKKLLMEHNLTEKFIFSYVESLEEFMKSLDLTDETERRKVENNCQKSIELCASEKAAEVTFQKVSKDNQTVHWLKIENNQLIWCNTHGSINKLQEYVDNKESEVSLVEEDNLIKHIRYKKVVIVADEPGMGKTTTLTRFYESELFLEINWIITINLRDQIQAIKNIQLANGNIDVVNFLSEVDIKLNHNLSKSLLRFALDKSKNILKPLLLVFDGFDEVLDVEDRRKLISLLKFLKEETDAKIWITTRVHYKEILESLLSTFAIEFDPLNDDCKVAYIKKYLKDRMCLILNEKKIAEVFVQDDKMQENKNIEIYITEFLNKIKSVFQSNASEFIGTPLQLYLMLEGSISPFRDFVVNSEDKSPNFDYLGENIFEIYKHFLDKKYGVYYKKMGIKEGVRQEEDKYIFTQYNKAFARSLILKSKPKKALEKFKDMVLSAGIIKSHGRNLEFIHTTFRDYFAAKVFIRWIKSVPDEPSRTYKQEYILKEILKKPDYQLIRTFIDLKLKKYAEIQSFKESVKQYGVVAEKLFREEESSLIDDEHSVLHYAVQEGNKSILCFFLDSLKEHKDVLKKVLFHRVVYERSAFDLVFHRNDIEIMRLLLDAARGISEKTLQELLLFYDAHGKNVLDTAAVFCKNLQIAKELLDRVENKLDFVMNENKEHSSLNVALAYNNGDFVKFLIQEFKNDKDSLKQLLLFYDKDYGNVLEVALCHDTSMVDYLLCTAKEMNDQNATLKEMLVPEKHVVPLKIAISTRNIHFVQMLLNVAKDINDDTLKNMFLKDVLEESVFLFAAKIGQCDIIKLLIETADSLGKEVLKKFAFAVNKDGKNAIHLMVEFQGFFRNISVDILKLLLETATSLGEEVLEKLVFGSDKNDKTPIHLFAEFDLGDIIAELFKIPGEFKYQCIRKRAMEMFHSLSEEHNLITSKYRLIHSIKINIISEVKRILENAKNFNLKRNEKFRNLLLTVDSEKFKHNTLHIACKNGNLRIIKELLSFAININDGGTTLMQLITSTSIFNITPFQMLKFGYTSEITQIVESLILEAKENNNGHVVNILQEINYNYAEINSSSIEYSLLLCNSYPFNSY